MLKKIKKNIKPIAVILLVILAGLVYWYWQRNVYSKDTLRLEILGPSQVDFAKEFDYTVKYKNNGDVYLEEAKLIFEYPDYSIAGNSQALRQEIAIEDIYPGQEKTMTFPARLLGQEGDIKTAKATISYKPKNLKARYESQTTLATQLNSLPLNFEFDLPVKIESGKTFKFRLNYFSNIDYPLAGLRIEAQYPAGFTFASSKPAALETTEWELPLVNKTEGGRIEITGSLSGEIGEQKIFSAKLGMWQNGEFIIFKEITKGLEMAKPALQISQRINGSQGYSVRPGDLLHYEIYFKNLGSETLGNLSLINTLSGDLFDLQSLRAPSGTFTLGDNSIIWDWRKTTGLQFLEPQEESKVEFWVNLRDDFEIPSMSGNLTAKNTVYLNQLEEEFEIKVSSKLELAQNAFYQDEIFGNFGPIPPRVGQSTTYTINWQAKNYYNGVKNVKVKTILPQSVQLTGQIFPKNSSLTFDSLSREIVWDIGDMTIGQGVLNQAPNVSFQVSLTPNNSQIGQIANLLNQTIISGEDSWTNTFIQTIIPSLNSISNATDTASIQQGIIRY